MEIAIWQRGRVMSGQRSMLLVVAVAILCLAVTASAHEATIAEIRVDAGSANMRVELDVVDVDFVLGLRDSGRPELLVADIRRAAPEIERYVLDRVSVDGCVLAPQDPEPGLRNGFSPAVVIGFAVQCATEPGDRVIRSRLFAELPGYRTLVAVSSPDGVQSYPVIDGMVTVSEAGQDRTSSFALFVTEGFHHIFAGFDHLLFLFLLVLPVVRSGSFRGSVVRVAGIVTAFTVAHSITLALSSFGYLSLPANIVEPIIAGSIVVAAILNIVVGKDRILWPVAYLFGLIHGFGFAGAFAELADGSALRWTDLFGFNLGVEIGQLAVTIGALVLLSLVSRIQGAERLLVPTGSLVVGTVGALWFAERVF